MGFLLIIDRYSRYSSGINHNAVVCQVLRSVNGYGVVQFA